MTPEALSCPNCGAPLPAPREGQIYVICPYCDSSIRVVGTPGAASARDEEVAAETVAQVKQLILEGRREEATQLYAKAGGITAQEAAEAIESLASDLNLSVVLDQQLRPAGWILAMLPLLLAGGGIMAGIFGIIGWPWAWLVCGIGALLFWPFSRGVRTTIRFAGAPVAEATVLRLARIGENRHVHTVHVLVEVHPPDSPAFQTQFNMASRADHMTRLHEGTVFQVRYLPNEPNAVIFDRSVDT